MRTNNDRPALELQLQGYRLATAQIVYRLPDHPGILTVDWLVAMYAWHSRHHVAHVTSLRERMGW